jgi:hypothetical protein
MVRSTLDKRELISCGRIFFRKDVEFDPIQTDMLTITIIIVSARDTGSNRKTKKGRTAPEISLIAMQTLKYMLSVEKACHARSDCRTCQKSPDATRRSAARLKVPANILSKL